MGGGTERLKLLDVVCDYSPDAEVFIMIDPYCGVGIVCALIAYGYAEVQKEMEVAQERDSNLEQPPCVAISIYFVSYSASLLNKVLGSKTMLLGLTSITSPLGHDMIVNPSRLALFTKRC